MRHLIASLLAFAMALQPAALCAQTAFAVDARVYLADGSVVQGQLLERTDDLVILRDQDGEIHTFDTERVRHIVTLESLGSQARTVTETEFPYISFLGGTVAFGLISWLQFDTAADRDAEAKINQDNDLVTRARDLRDKRDRARLWGWSSAVLAGGSLGVALIPRQKTRKVFPELSLDRAGAPQVVLVYRLPL